jgi:hypothetical protein
MQRPEPRTPDPAPVTPSRTDGRAPSTDQVLPPPDDEQLHADLGLVSGGAAEEGNAREHRDG